MDPYIVIEGSDVKKIKAIALVGSVALGAIVSVLSYKLNQDVYSKTFQATKAIIEGAS